MACALSTSIAAGVFGVIAGALAETEGSVTAVDLTTSAYVRQVGGAWDGIWEDNDAACLAVLGLELETACTSASRCPC